MHDHGAWDAVGRACVLEVWRLGDGVAWAKGCSGIVYTANDIPYHSCLSTPCACRLCDVQVCLQGPIVCRCSKRLMIKVVGGECS